MADAEEATPAAPAEEVAQASGAHEVSGTMNDEDRLKSAQDAESKTMQNHNLDSPRFREAFKRTGLTKNDLKIKGFQEFAANGQDRATQRLKFHHYEKERQKALTILLKEREKVTVENARAQGTAAKSYQSLAMIEVLLDQEAKRLEKSLRAQLRYHTAVEKENETQLESEKKLHQNLRRREERFQVVEKDKQAKAHRLKAVLREKRKAFEKLRSDALAKVEEQQENYKAMVAEGEDRLARWRENKVVASADKFEAWKKKREAHQENMALQDLKRQAYEEQMNARRKKAEEMAKIKKAEEAKAFKKKCQESQLKLEDAKTKQARLIRQQKYQREQLAKSLAEKTERVDTLVQLKDQIVNQRRNRSKAAGASNGKMVIDIRSYQPGPADYAGRRSCLNEIPVPKFAVTGRDDTGRELKPEAPPPGTYDPKVLRDGEKFFDERSVSIGKGLRKNYIDEYVKAFKAQPGPGKYDSKSSLDDPRAPKMLPQYIKGYIDFENPTLCDNGPSAAEYNTTEFLRKNNQKSKSVAPALAKAMFLQSS